MLFKKKKFLFKNELEILQKGLQLQWAVEFYSS